MRDSSGDCELVSPAKAVFALHRPQGEFNEWVDDDVQQHDARNSGHHAAEFEELVSKERACLLQPT